MFTQGRSLNKIRFKTMRLLAAALACCVLQTAPLRGQVRKLHTRDLTRLSQIQVADYLKRSDIVFIPIGAVETNGIMPSEGSEPTQLTFDHGRSWPYGFSPDGDKIIFAANSPATGRNIYTANADGSGLTQVTHDGGDDDPAWGTHPPVGSAEPTADHTLREPNGRSQRPWPC